MLATIDIVILVLSLIVVAAVSMIASRGERSREDYFLAGRNLTWWLIGFSLIASNISTEHFVGTTGKAAANGIAVAGYEWVAAIALVFVAWWILPVMLRTGIYTMPEFLEYRFDRTTRSIMAGLMVIFFVLTVLATVLFAGSTFLSSVLDLPGYLQRAYGMETKAAETLAFQLGDWGIGIAAGVYTVFGGLKAVVWSDLIQGAGLLLGGAVVAVIGALRPGWRAGPDRGLDRLYAGTGRQNAPRPHVGRSGPPGPRTPDWHLDPGDFLLGAQPVHHPAHTRGGLARRGTEGHPLRRGNQTRAAAHDRDPRHDGGADPGRQTRP